MLLRGTVVQIDEVLVRIAGYTARLGAVRVPVPVPRVQVPRYPHEKYWVLARQSTGKPNMLKNKAKN